MKTQIKIFVLLVVLTPCLVFACLGDTPESLAARMGAAGVDITNSTNCPFANSRLYSFEKNGITLVVTFWNGKSCEESYKKVDGGEFSDVEIQTMLEQNSFGSSWEPDDTTAPIKSWTWGGTKNPVYGVQNPVMQAVYASGLFGMYTTKFKQSEDAARTAAGAAADRKRAQGF